jgi:hypothetical protein
MPVDLDHVSDLNSTRLIDFYKKICTVKKSFQTASLKSCLKTVILIRLTNHEVRNIHSKRAENVKDFVSVSQRKKP